MQIEVEHWLPEPGGPISQGPQLLNCGPMEISAVPRAQAGSGRGRLGLRAPINAHDHGYGIRTLDFGCPDDALEPWICGLRQRPRTDPYLEALVAFGRLALSGCAGTVHCHNSLNVDRLSDEATAVVKAAASCGLRLALCCPLIDSSPFVYGGIDALQATDPTDRAWLHAIRPRPAPAAEQIAAVEAVAARHQGAMVDVQFGPIGPQWCSDELLSAIAEASDQSGRRVHMHLLESPRQRLWLDRRFPGGVMRHLDAIGLLSPQLTVAHGVQLRPDEWQLLAERGVRLASNPAANLRLRSGVLPSDALRTMDWAVGLDGTGFDDAQDIWHELRLMHLLHGGNGLEPALSPARVLRAAIETAAAIAGAPVGCDLVVVDWKALTRDAMLPDDDPSVRLLARMSRLLVTDLVVAGRSVVANRHLSGFDFDAACRELADQARARLDDAEQRRAEARRLSGIVRTHYAALQPKEAAAAGDQAET